MALQDLTPQLRTRLSRMERAAGWFVLLATLLMLAGLGYYLKVMAERKGWGVQKIYYQTSLASATGLKVGNPVQLMGFNVGEITRIEANAPTDYDYGVTIYFWIKKPYYGYLWSDSKVKVSSELLGGRFLEVTKGVMGVPTVLETTNRVAEGVLRQNYFKQELQKLLKQTNPLQAALIELNTAAARQGEIFYARISADTPYWLDSAESLSMNDRFDKIANQVEAALPNILAFTNHIAAVLDTNRIAMIMSNAATITTDIQAKLSALGPAITNLSRITGNLTNANGSLGDWLMATNLYPVVKDVDLMVENLANLTSNLNAQVQANPALLNGASTALSNTAALIQNTDELVQGLKRHWLLRSAFKTKKTNAPPATAR